MLSWHSCCEPFNFAKLSMTRFQVESAKQSSTPPGTMPSARALVQQIDQNRVVLTELGRKGATLEVQRSRTDASKVYLIIEHATVWTVDQEAVVEVK